MDLHRMEVETGERLLTYFTYDHLPPNQQDIPRWFAELAVRLVVNVSTSAQRTRALHKLLDAKDCAVRAAL